MKAEAYNAEFLKDDLDNIEQIDREAATSDGCTEKELLSEGKRTRDADGTQVAAVQQETQDGQRQVQQRAFGYNAPVAQYVTI